MTTLFAISAAYLAGCVCGIALTTDAEYRTVGPATLVAIIAIACLVVSSGVLISRGWS